MNFSRAGFFATSPRSFTTSENEPVFWAKDGASIQELHHEGLAHEPYLSLHDRALEQRMQGRGDEDMEFLYQFWSHFLIRNFNLGMYEEFRALAMDHQQHGFSNGHKHLIRYYETLLLGKAPLSDRIAQDVVAMAESETGDSRPAFQKLRSAWRNGAFNLKSRKKVDNILSPELRTELEK